MTNHRTGADHHKWAGEVPNSYRTAQRRRLRALGPASDWYCRYCDNLAIQWTLTVTPAPMVEVRGKRNLPWSPNHDDYSPTCRWHAHSSHREP